MTKETSQTLTYKWKDSSKSHLRGKKQRPSRSNPQQQHTGWIQKQSIDNQLCYEWQWRERMMTNNSRDKLDRGEGAINYQDGDSGGHLTTRGKISSERFEPSWCCSSSVSRGRRRGRPLSTSWPGWRWPQVKKDWFCAPVVGWHLRRLGLHLWSPLHSSGTPGVYIIYALED